MKNVKIFIRVHDKDMQKATKGALEGKDYVDVVVEDIASAEERMVDIAIVGLNNYQGKLLADKLRDIIPGVKVIPFFSDHVDYGDVNTVCTDISRIDEIIKDLIKEKEKTKVS